MTIVVSGTEEGLGWGFIKGRQPQGNGRGTTKPCSRNTNEKLNISVEHLSA